MDNFVDWMVTPRMIVSAVAIVVGLFILALASKLMKKRISKVDTNEGKKKMYYQVLATVVRFLILLLLIIVVLQINGVNISSLVAGLGIISAVIGLALQDTLRDVCFGIYIITDHFYEVGDVVRYKDHEYIVLAMNLKTTKLKSITTSDIATVCNRNISEITRCSEYTDLDVPLSYGEKIGDVHSAMEEICKRISAFDNAEKAEFKGTQSFEASSILYRIRVYCLPADRPQVLRDSRLAVQTVLEERNITIPFNQIDVHYIDEKTERRK